MLQDTELWQMFISDTEQSLLKTRDATRVIPVDKLMENSTQFALYKC